MLSDLADASMGGVGLVEGRSIAGQLLIQLESVIVAIVWSGVLTYVILKLIGLVTPLRVDAESETEGLDVSLHNERGYNF